MIGHVIVTYDNLDDARIQQEISKQLYAKAFGGVRTVHAYNGKASFGYTRYLEDDFIRLKNRGHFAGAVDLINAGIARLSTLKHIRYAIVTSADTWAIDTRFLKQLVHRMEREGRVFAASSLHKTGDTPDTLSLDFFIVDLAWNRSAKMFPINYNAFLKKFSDYYIMQWSQPSAEQAVLYAFNRFFVQTYQDNRAWIERERKFLRITEREPILLPGHHRRFNWPGIGIYSEPLPQVKRRALKARKLDLGKYSHKLVTTKNTGYYNRLKHSSVVGVSPDGPFFHAGSPSETTPWARGINQ